MRQKRLIKTTDSPRKKYYPRIIQRKSVDLFDKKAPEAGGARDESRHDRTNRLAISMQPYAIALIP